MTHSDDPLSSAFQQIDEIITGSGWVSFEVSEAIRELLAASPGRPPLTRLFASRLLKPSRPKVALLTGFVVPELFPQGENDGPLGSIVLAQALARAGLEPVLFTDPPLIETARWLAAEVGAAFPVQSISELEPDVAARSFGAVVTIEKPGANSTGTLHTFDGQAIRHGSLEVEPLLRSVQQQGIPIFAIGDRGNEAGFGAIRGAVVRVFPHAAKCRCGCLDGIVAASRADYVLPAAVSNWGAYGVCAALALLTRDPKLAHVPEAEERLLRVAAVRGCADGVLRRGGFGVDGLPGRASVGVVQALREVVEDVLKHPGRA